MPGLYYDELHVGQVFHHAICRTVTEADNVWFSALTHNPAYLHLDEEYGRAHTPFGQRVVNSAFTLGLMVGDFRGRHYAGHHRCQPGLGRGSFPCPRISWRYATYRIGGHRHAC
jgi:acyl dehydratase